MDKTSAINLKSLRWHLALFLLAALLAGGAAVAALRHHEEAERRLGAARAALADTRAMLARVHEDEREIRARIVRYKEIIAKGRTQPERRLEWVETLRDIRESRRLLGLDYEIAPQRPLDEKAPEAGGYLFLASPMRLEMPLLHENDLLGLLADLEAQTQALLSVRKCRIERTGAAPFAGALKAACEIDWITLQEKS